MRIRLLSYILAAAAWLLPLPLAAGPQPFFLKNGDTVVFYGDSITAQNQYTQIIELYTVTRFPLMHVRFFGAGVGGDSVSGGFGGGVDLRLSRDVYPYRPSVITIMLGMNDGGYHPADRETDNAYVKGYEHILSSLHDTAPSARVVVLGPSPFDDITRPPQFAGGYNSVMRHFADMDRSLARDHGDDFVNLNGPVEALIEKAHATDPVYAPFILPDRVHPASIGHWVMAAAILKEWNASSLVSSVSIEAHTPHVEQSQNAAVEHLEADNTTLRWTETENALPLPFNADNAFEQRILQLTDVQNELNQESLRITGLKPGNYALAIDGEAVGEFSSRELSAGINLADFHTPMRSQADSVGWLIDDRIRAHETRMTMLIHKAETRSVGDKGDVLLAFEDSIEKAIYDAAAPKPHSFTLKLVPESVKGDPGRK